MTKFDAFRTPAKPKSGAVCKRGGASGMGIDKRPEKAGRFNGTLLLYPEWLAVRWLTTSL